MTKHQFPPRSERPQDIQALAGMLACAVSGRTAVYIATPITSGRRFIDWYSRCGRGLAVGTAAYREEHRRHVVEPNLAHAAAAVRRIRATHPRVVLDPTAVELANWVQADYHTLWATVIERYADTVVFLDGWEYSEGCAYEFITALRTEAKPLREDLTPLRLADGRTAVREAVRVTEERDVPMPLLSAVARELKNLRRQPEAP